MFTKKQVLLCAGILVLSTLSFRSVGQLYVGLEAGGNQNYLITNVSNLVSTEYSPKSGFCFAIPIQYKINDWFAIEAAPGFTDKNYQMKRTGFYEGVYQDTKSHYLQLPIGAKFSFGGKKLKGFVDAGGFVAHWSSCHIKGAMPNPLDDKPYGSTLPFASLTIFDYVTPYNYDEKYQFNTTKDNRFEGGVYAGVGLSYEPQKNWSFFTAFKYYDGLTDLQKNYELGGVPRYNETASFTVGFLYKPSFCCLKMKHCHKTTSSTTK